MIWLACYLLGIKGLAEIQLPYFIIDLKLESLFVFNDLVSMTGLDQD